MVAEQLKPLVPKIIRRANEMSEQWSGTTTGKIIDACVESLKRSMQTGKFELASVQVSRLARTCEDAERGYDGY